MRAYLLAEDYKTVLEEVNILEDFYKAVKIERYDQLTETWFVETVNALRIRKLEE